MNRIRVPAARMARKRVCSLGILLAALLFWVPEIVRSELRPLVPEMLEHLALVNQIGRGVALDDYDLVKSAAAELEAQAKTLQEFDITLLHVTPKRDEEFDAYLQGQQKAAKLIIKAAEAKDGRAVFLGVEQLFEDGCTACHTKFREQQGLLRPPIMFMTSLLHAWQDINRGVATGDLELIGRKAREIQSLGRVLAWDQVIEEVFDVEEIEERKTFSSLVRRTIVHARRIEEAADGDEMAGAMQAARLMWSEGCIACHDRFRNGS